MSVPTLYVVATPIGNLADLSPRAQEVLRSVAAICAEDTRRSGQLLSHFGIQQPLVALHEHNEEALAQRLVSRLQAGESLALVSDAGTPLVSDPGFRLVRAARARASGQPGRACHRRAERGRPASDRFSFEGFLPAKSRPPRPPAGAGRRSAHDGVLRILAPDRRIAGRHGGDLRRREPAVLARELTKLFETVLDGDLAGLLAKVEADDNQRKGEFVVMVQGAGDDEEAQLAHGRRVYAKLSEHLPPSTAAKLAAERPVRRAGRCTAVDGSLRARVHRSSGTGRSTPCVDEWTAPGPAPAQAAPTAPCLAASGLQGCGEGVR